MLNSSHIRGERWFTCCFELCKSVAGMDEAEKMEHKRQSIVARQSRKRTTAFAENAASGPGATVSFGPSAAQLAAELAQFEKVEKKKIKVPGFSSSSEEEEDDSQEAEEDKPPDKEGPAEDVAKPKAIAIDVRSAHNIERASLRGSVLGESAGESGTVVAMNDIVKTLFSLDKDILDVEAATDANTPLVSYQGETGGRQTGGEETSNKEWTLSVLKKKLGEDIVLGGYAEWLNALQIQATPEDHRRPPRNEPDNAFWPDPRIAALKAAGATGPRRTTTTTTAKT